MKRLETAVILVLAALLATPANADTVTWSGALVDLPDIPDADLAGCPAGARLQESYELTPFFVDTSGSYTIETTAASGMPQDPGDTLLALYDGSFEGSWPVNCLAVNDDAIGVLSQITQPLVAGQHYVALVTYAWQGSGNGIGATYSAQIDGPGVITLFIFIDGFETGDASRWSATQQLD